MMTSVGRASKHSGGVSRIALYGIGIGMVVALFAAGAYVEPEFFYRDYWNSHHPGAAASDG